MNEQTMRQAARDRLATADLATVLDAPIATVANSDANSDAAGPSHHRDEQSSQSSQSQPSHTRLLVAAVILLGFGVATGVAWLRAEDERTAAQQPIQLDPVRPWYAEYLPSSGKGIAIRSLEDFKRQSSPDHDYVFPAGTEQAKLIAALPKHAHAQRATILFDQSGRIDTSSWRSLGNAQQLQSLALSGRPKLQAADLRELQHASQLRSIMISARNALDEECAAALAELPQLCSLTFANTRVTADGLRALASARHLNTIIFLQTPLDDELIAATAQLQQLQAVVCNSCFDATSLSISAVRDLAKLPNLRALDLGNCDLDDEILRVLPAQVESLAFTGMGNVTAEGARSLARLRKLRSVAVRAEIPSNVQQALAEHLPSLPLENYECWVGQPTAALWRMLQAQPKLRGLTLNSQQGLNLKPIANLTHLERLTVASAGLIDPDALRGLAGHPTLREVRILEHPHRNRTDYRQAHRAHFVELRKRLGAKIRLLLD